jgi:hypothetical protein
VKCDHCGKILLARDAADLKVKRPVHRECLKDRRANPSRMWIPSSVLLPDFHFRVLAK